MTTATRAPVTKAARHAKIISLLESREIRSQTELAELLAGERLLVTQGTLSRDLVEIGALRVRGSGGRSLRVFPTASGRTAQGTADADEAWAEVLGLAADADQPGMRAQFDCHWRFARIVEPDKPSWNLEPWRPVVAESEMVDARCNPGGPESAET